MNSKKAIICVVIGIVAVFCIWNYFEKQEHMIANEQNIVSNSSIERKTAESVGKITPKPSFNNYDYSRFDWEKANVPDDIKTSFLNNAELIQILQKKRREVVEIIKQKDLFGVLYTNKSSKEGNDKREQMFFRKTGIQKIINKLFADKNIWRVQYVHNGSFALVFKPGTKDGYRVERLIELCGSAQEIVSYESRISHLYGNWYYGESVMKE